MNMSTTLISSFNILDIIGFVVLMITWIGYNRYVMAFGLKRGSIVDVMGLHRTEWMFRMIGKEERIFDAQIIRGLMGTVGFFASTSVLLLGAIVAFIGSSQTSIEILNSVFVNKQETLNSFVFKCCFLVIIFTYSFFKFGWSMRLHGYSAILVGSAPYIADKHSDERKKCAANISRVSTLAAQHFNAGVRGYYFALATLAWFISPIAMIVATVWILFILYRREFQSESYGLLDKNLDIES